MVSLWPAQSVPWLQLQQLWRLAWRRHTMQQACRLVVSVLPVAQPRVDLLASALVVFQRQLWLLDSRVS